MENIEETLRKRLNDLREDVSRYDAELDSLRDSEPGSQRIRELYLVRLKLRRELEDAEKQLAVAPIKQSIAERQRSERNDSVVRHSVLVIGCSAMMYLAFVFKGSSLAAIPLFGLVAFIILWPVFEKFRNLDRISAVFRTSGIDVNAAASNTDDFLRLQGDLARKKVQLELARIDKQIEGVHHQNPPQDITAIRPAKEQKSSTQRLSLGELPDETR